MTLAAQLFDLTLLLVLVWVAWRLLRTPDLFKAVVLFIAFGLLMALVWARLGAIDVALAEAAIGAGLTGVLFLTTVSRVKRDDPGLRLDTAPKRSARRAAATALVFTTLSLSLAVALVALPPPSGQLAALALERLPETGVANPVTGVLLNFRAYDTLLEVGVLLLAVIAAWSVGTAAVTPFPGLEVPGPLLNALARVLAPLMVLVAVYLVSVGAYAPGGAFQAGTVLGAAGILALLAGVRQPAAPWLLPLRGLLASGFAVFLGAGGVVLASGLFLQYPAGSAYAYILAIEVALTVSTGVVLAALFVGAEPGRGVAARDAGEV